VAGLGFSTLDQFEVPDFDEPQLHEFLRQAGVERSVPDWVPMRSLLLGYPVSIDASIAEGGAGSMASWIAAASDLVVEVAAGVLLDQQESHWELTANRVLPSRS